MSKLNDLLATIEVCRRSLPVDGDRALHLERLADIERLVLQATAAGDREREVGQPQHDLPSSSEVDKLTGP